MHYLGYNGQLHEARNGWQLLGNGYRAYNPALMCFHSPDSLSPFGPGGCNGYGYCSRDPANKQDPSGHFAVPAMLIGLPATVAALSATGAVSISDEPLKEGLFALTVVSGLIAAASMASVAGGWLRSRLPHPVQRAKYRFSHMKRNPGGSYLKGQPRQPESRSAQLKTSFSSLQRAISRKVQQKPRFRYKKAPPPDPKLIRKTTPVERRALLSSGYPPLREKPDSTIYLDSLGRFHFESSV